MARLPASLQRSALHYGRLVAANATKARAVLKAANGNHALLVMEQQDIVVLQPTTQVHGPLGSRGPLCLSLAGDGRLILARGISGFVSFEEAMKLLFSKAVLPEQG